jgi:hypothetical protein
MIWIKLTTILIGLAMIGSALLWLVAIWPFILIPLGLIIGVLLLQWAANL